LAGDLTPFSITQTDVGQISVECAGPWGRLSGCVTVADVPAESYPFYWVEHTVFSPVGTWWCAAYRGSRCDSRRLIAQIHFCGPGAGNSPIYVDLLLDQQKLTVNQASSCTGTVVRSVLGQTGEADDTPAQDIDSYSFAGKAGEAVEVTFGRDGSAGSVGDVATLRLRTAGGAVVGERTGAVPLKLETTLPGPVEIVVSRGPGGGNALRGGYELEVVPASGAVGDRKLRPTENVED
jgi:hypothetical protein